MKDQMRKLVGCIKAATFRGLDGVQEHEWHVATPERVSVELLNARPRKERNREAKLACENGGHLIRWNDLSRLVVDNGLQSEPCLRRKFALGQAAAPARERQS